MNTNYSIYNKNNTPALAIPPNRLRSVGGAQND